MSKFNKMNRQQKRSSRLLALQLMYANEITDTNNTKFLKEIFDIKSSINGSSDKHEVLSSLDISSEMALSILPESIKEKYLETIKSFDDKNLDHISNSINKFQSKLNSYKKDIQAYALEIFKVSKNILKNLIKRLFQGLKIGILLE